MASPRLSDVVSHWDHLFEEMQQSPQDFYARLDVALTRRNLPKASYSRVELSQGGMFSGKRLYYRARRKEYIFDICGAPFGNGFFVSWWLTEPQGCFAALAEIPYVGIPFLLWKARRETYYKIDTQLMFQQSVHAAVVEVLDAMTSAQGVRALSEAERKPIMRDFLSARGR